MVIFNWWTTLDKLLTIATKKVLSPIYEIRNFANTYLGKVTKFQGNGLFCFGVLSHLLSWRWKTPPPPPMVLIGLKFIYKHGHEHFFQDTTIFFINYCLTQKIRKWIFVFTYVEFNSILFSISINCFGFLTLLDMGFFEPSVLGGGSFVVTARMILKFRTGTKVDLFHTVVTETFMTSLPLRNYDVIMCILCISVDALEKILDTQQFQTPWLI